MPARLRRFPLAVVLGVALVSAVLVPLAERPARAKGVEVGLEWGIQKRHLAETSYDVGFGWQLHAEFALLPPILLVGTYATFADAAPNLENISSKGALVATGVAVSFRTVGMRALVRLPIPGRFKPYGVAGLGWVHGDFPSQRLIGLRTKPATANLVEFVIGAGFTWNLYGPLAFTTEFDWRPTIGYYNDAYQKQMNVAGGNPQLWPMAADPSHNGVSYTGMVGLALAL